MRRLLVVVVVGLLSTAACTGGPRPRSEGSPRGPWHGGTLRVVSPLPAVSFLDPVTSGVDGIHHELFRCCLLRTLMSYNGRTAEEGGALALPDLAREPPDVSSDGLTWTFTLREGLRYAPPLEQTPIVASDVVRAIERIPPPPAGYTFRTYFRIIEGYDAFLAGRADSISGLETPDPDTLVVRLTRPTGDLAYRFALATTAPVPPGVSRGDGDEYFRFLIASGPYMVAGGRDLDFSVPPAKQRPVSGFIPQDRIDEAGRPRVALTLVRNPSWDPATDPLRGAYVDRIELTSIPAGLPDAGFRDLQRGLADGRYDVMAAMSLEMLDRFRSHPMLVPSSDIEPVPMNLGVPPFDDVEVRRAVSLAVDRRSIVRRFSGVHQTLEYRMTIGHLFPDTVESGLIDPTWRPSWASGFDGSSDLDAARAHMARSRYDTDGDGRCEDRSCRRVPVVVQAGWPTDHEWFWKTFAEDLRPLGIEFDPIERTCIAPDGTLPFAETALRASARYAMAIGECFGWLSDYPNASTFAIPLLHSDSISAEWTDNFPMLGASRELLASWDYAVTDVPSVDDRIDGCARLTGTSQVRCWAELDQYVSDEIVPWVPIYTTSRMWLASDRVAQTAVSISSKDPALDRISLVPGSE